MKIDCITKYLKQIQNSYLNNSMESCDGICFSQPISTIPHVLWIHLHRIIELCHSVAMRETEITSDQ